MKNFLCLLSFLLSATTLISFAACPSIPVAPSCPGSGSTIPANGGMSGTSGTTYLVNGSQSPGPNLNGGGPGVTIYICAGTLSISGDFNVGSGTLVYIMAGATLSIGGNYNGGTTYVYGTLSTTGVSLQNNNANIYVASSGVWNASSAIINMNGGAQVVIEGTANLNNLNQFQNSSTQFCVNKGGCAQFNTITTNALQVDNGFVSDNGIGYIYWANTTCPPISNAHVLSTTPALQICSAENPGPCAFWGSATVKYNCVPGAGTGTTANCAGAIALPLDLAFFDASKTQEGVQVKWATFKQVNSDYFAVEVSHDGKVWQEIGMVAAKHNYEGYMEYVMNDPTPEPGLNYYRLKEVALNKEEKNYAVKLVTFSLDGFSFLAYPNPSQGKMTLYLGNEYEQYALSVYDTKGSLVGNYTLHGGVNEVQFDSPGMYLAKLKVGYETKVKKLVVQ